MEAKWKYLTPEDETKIMGFVRHYMSHFAPVPQKPLFHYTTGENLIRIIESGQLWSTHIACLNDSAELVFAIDELKKRIDSKLPASGSNGTEMLLSKLDDVLSRPAVEIASIFVTCFSEEGDDLSQWRAYSGGEGGYAIRFDSTKLRSYGSQGLILLKVDYDGASQAMMLDDVVKWFETYFLTLDGRERAPTRDEWAKELVDFFLEQLTFFAPALKHSAFSSEREWRLVTAFRPDDPTRLQFRQRQSMMTRHLPLKMEGRLPITGITVGPCRHPNLSRIAVGDLVVSAGYDIRELQIDVTKVPYRAV